MAQDGPKMAQDGPRWPEDGPKMEPRWSQDGAKMASKSAPGPLSYVAELHTDADCPKSSKLASSVSEMRFFAELGPTFAVRQRYQNLPPSNTPNASRQSRNYKACNKFHTFPLYCRWKKHSPLNTHNRWPNVGSNSFLHSPWPPENAPLPPTRMDNPITILRPLLDDHATKLLVQQYLYCLLTLLTPKHLSGHVRWPLTH